AMVHGPAADDLRLVTGLVLFGVASLGFAAAYGRQTLLARVASRSAAGATMLARVLAFSALAVWIGVPLAVERFGPRASLAVPALLIVAVGVVLVAHEPAGTLRTRRARLAAALTVLVLAILLASTAGMGW
ncbi:MAG: hypothetical protein KJ749_13340, partial [Planctomycetes bacterium]|nr:hypothetical protein [Planctomycetota bacterium]